MKIELLYFEGCPGYAALLPRIRELVAEQEGEAELLLRPVETPEAALSNRFLGSPSVRVAGQDIEPGADDRDDFGLKCRLYRSDEGLVRTPPEQWIRAALKRAA